MKANDGPGKRIQDMWLRTRGLPGGTHLFSWLLGRMVPYSSTIGAHVVHLEPGFARVQLRDRRKVRNHLRSVHAIAMANLAELSTGLALNCGLPGTTRSILLGISLRYDKKARGKLTSECRCTIPDVTAEQDLEIEGRILDESGDVVARATATWRVAPLLRKAS